MRWWAINQIFCRNGRLSHLNFYNGDIIPNQDGINLRIGCSRSHRGHHRPHRGRSSRVTLLGSDRALSVEDRDSDVYDVTIRDVRAYRQTVVALRNCDSTVYRIRIENTPTSEDHTAVGCRTHRENNYISVRRFPVRPIRSASAALFALPRDGFPQNLSD